MASTSATAAMASLDTLSLPTQGSTEDTALRRRLECMARGRSPLWRANAIEKRALFDGTIRNPSNPGYLAHACLHTKYVPCRYDLMDEAALTWKQRDRKGRRKYVSSAETRRLYDDIVSDLLDGFFECMGQERWMRHIPSLSSTSSIVGPIEDESLCDYFMVYLSECRTETGLRIIPIASSGVPGDYKHDYPSYIASARASFGMMLAKRVRSARPSSPPPPSRSPLSISTRVDSPPRAKELEEAITKLRQARAAVDEALEAVYRLTR